MKQLDTNNQSGIIENLHAQSGQALATTTLNDLPINEAQADDVKGGNGYGFSFNPPVDLEKPIHKWLARESY